MKPMDAGEPKMKGRRKAFMRILLFMAVLCLLLMYLVQVFGLANSDLNKKIFKAFYAEKENTVDAVYMGTSATNRYFISLMAYDREGIAVFVLATMGMPLFFVPDLIEEVEKTQNPKLYIIELRWVLNNSESMTDAHIRRVTDSMKYSHTRKEAIARAMEFTKDTDGELGDITHDPVDYRLSFLKYHNRLAAGDLGIGDILLFNSKNKTKGYVASKKTTEVVSQKKAVYSNDRQRLCEEAELVLEEVLDYCDKLEDKEVLFVLSPYSVTKSESEKFNSAVDMVSARGYDVVNFNTEEMAEKLDLNWKQDFYNRKHVNYRGAEKYTKYLAKYIKDNYSLSDRRGDAQYESWAKAYDYYLNYISEHKDEKGV